MGPREEIMRKVMVRPTSPQSNVERLPAQQGEAN